MRCENLRDWAQDKVTWKSSRDQQRNCKTWWRRTPATLLSVSFGIYRRSRRDVLMGRQRYVPLRRLGEVPLRRRWVCHLRLAWDVQETHWWDVVVTSSWDVVMTFQEDVVETYYWDVFETFHRDVAECFIWDIPAMLLERTERRRYDVAATSCCQVGFLGSLNNVINCINRIGTCISGTFGQTFCGIDKIRYDFNPFSLMDTKLFPIYWGLVVKALDSQSGDLVFKTTGWLYGQLSLSSFGGRPNEYQEILET